MKHLLLIAFTAVLIFTSIRTKAQTNNDSTRYEKVKKVNESLAYNYVKGNKKVIRSIGSKAFAKQLFSPEASSISSLINSTSSVNLQSEFGQQEASATIGGTYKSSTFAATIKQPFSEKPSKVNPLSLDGLDNGTSVKFGWQLYLWHLRDLEKVVDIFYKVKESFYAQHYSKSKKISCDSLNIVAKKGSADYYYKSIDSLGKDNWIKVDSFRRISCCCCSQKDSLLKDSILIFYPVDIVHKDHDDIVAINNLSYAQLDSASQASFYNKVVVKTFLLNASASFAKNKFDYIPDSFSIKPTSASKVNQSYNVAAGVILNPSNTKLISVLALSYVLSKSYQTPGDPVDYTFPIGTNGANYTEKVAIGIPSNKLSSRVSLEWRRRFQSIAIIKDLAISPSASYLFDKHSLAVSMPIYFLQYKENGKFAGLQGGVNLGYLTKTDHLAKFSDGFNASIFIAAPFDLFSGF